MKHALDLHVPLDSLALRTRRSDNGSLQPSAAAAAAAAAAPISSLVKQLQACVLWLQRPSVAGAGSWKWVRSGLIAWLAMWCAAFALPVPTPCPPPSSAAGIPPVTAVHTADAAANLMLFASAAAGHAAAARLVLLLSPSAATTRQGGQLPIHVCASGCHLDCLQVLLDVWPATALSTDAQGCLPLHRAAAASHGGERRHHAESVHLLLAAAPQTVTARTAHVSKRMGRPCHCRPTVSSPFSLVAHTCTPGGPADPKLGMNCCPCLPCGQDELALHLAAAACRWSKSVDAVQALLSAAPQPGGAAAAAAATDGHGRVPLVSSLEGGRAGQAICLAGQGKALARLAGHVAVRIWAHPSGGLHSGDNHATAPAPAALRRGGGPPAHPGAAAARGAQLGRCP